MSSLRWRTHNDVAAPGVGERAIDVKACREPMYLAHVACQLRARAHAPAGGGGSDGSDAASLAAR